MSEDTVIDPELRTGRDSPTGRTIVGDTEQASEGYGRVWMPVLLLDVNDTYHSPSSPIGRSYAHIPREEGAAAAP